MKNYNCYYQRDESEGLNIDEIFYMVKNFYLVEIVLDNWLAIRQRNEIPCNITVIKNWEEQKETINTWNLYLTDGYFCYDIRKRWGEDELEKWIDDCEKLKK